MKIVVIGAGPAGLSAALKLCQEHKCRVQVIESDGRVGGMAKTVELWGQLVDIGPHRFFTFNKEVEDFWKESVDHKYMKVHRLTRIYYDNKFYFYPLQINDVLKNLGFIESIFCLLSFLKAKLFPEKDESHFSGWVINRFGARLFQKFFKTYSEKLWGIPCEQLNSEFAAQRIKKLSFSAVLQSYFSKSIQRKHKSLVDVFDYPLQGSGAVYEGMVNKISALGGQVKMNTKVTAISRETNSVWKLTLDNGEVVEADHLISTMPIDTFITNFDSAPESIKAASRKLKFRNTIIVYVEVNRSDLFKDQWLYIHSSQIQTGRITNFRNWSPELYRNKSTTILSLEYWCNNEDKIWSMKNQDLHAIAKTDIIENGFVKEHEILNCDVIRIPKCYPVYTNDYQHHMASLKDFLANYSNLTVIGRSGSFKYNNQDHSILMGLKAAENIRGAENDLWSINNDYDYQEEEANSRTTNL